ncbi:nuclease [Vibrionales bacterium C3R12]|nr:nuclease [Vibrionales bacterium C3R12]
MNKKITILAGAISCALSGAALADINDIVITEYVEGSAQNKAVEISNLHATQNYTFDGTLGLYYSSHKNQIKNASNANVLTGITIPAGESIVIVNGEVNSDVVRYIERLSGRDNAVINAGTYDEVAHSAMNFNGDDAVWLGTSDNAAGVKDIFGTFGHSGDKLWADRSMRRKASATAQSSIYTESDWEQFDKDSFGGLGHPTNVDDSPLPALPEPPVAAPCDDATDLEVKTIGEIQGDGASSPLIPEGEYKTPYYKITGRVSNVIKSADQAISPGFYLQADDNNPLTSNGVFVYSQKADETMLGQEVCVIASAKEYFGLTQLNQKEDGDWQVINETPAIIEATELKRLTSDKSFAETLERHEGMLVKLVDDMDDKATGDQNMRVTRAFSFDFDLLAKRKYRNNMVLAYDRVNRHPNQDHVAGSIDSMKQAAENQDSELYVDSETAPENGNIPYFSAFNTDPNANYIRVTDSIKDLEGVISYNYDEYRLIPTGNFDLQNSSITHHLPRQRKDSKYGNYKLDLNESYGDDGFTVKIATQNVLNYFNSPYGGADNQKGDNRGAKSQPEFERQQAKIVEAIFSLDADIVGLMEIENNGFGDFSAINTLLKAVNLKYTDDDYKDRNKINSTTNKYVFVGFDKNGDQVLDSNDVVGSDVITSGIIYRPAKVSVVRGEIIPMPSQDAPIIVGENGAPLLDKNGDIRESGKNYQRNTVVATFKVLNTGKELTVAVNHLKSKGSTCYEDWAGWEEWKDFDPVYDDPRNDDYQGSCENFRVAAAYQLGSEMAKMPGDQVVLGDMNSYSFEDPMLVLTENKTEKDIYAAGYTYVNGEPLFGPEGALITKSFGYVSAVDKVVELSQSTSSPKEKAWSYSYESDTGSLDHLLVTKSLENRLVDATDWHINAAESSLYDYSNYKKEPNEMENPFYEKTPFRSSDHDSAILSLGYKYGEAGESLVTLAATSGRLQVPFVLTTPAVAGDKATITMSPMPEGDITLSSQDLSAGDAMVTFDVLGVPTGEYTFTMTMTNSSDVAATSTASNSQSMTVNVIKQDSSNVKPTTPSYDGSGGAFGFGALLSLFGFGFLRRRRN